MVSTAIIEDVIHRYRISMKISRVASNPICHGACDSGEMEHYRCRLLKPGRQLEVYVSCGAEDGKVALSEVLMMLAMDASGCRMLEGCEQYRDEWSVLFGDRDGNSLELEEFWREYRGRCNQSRAFREFLGNSAYEELLQTFRFEEDVTGFVREELAAAAC